MARRRIKKPRKCAPSVEDSSSSSSEEEDDDEETSRPRKQQRNHVDLEQREPSTDEHNIIDDDARIEKLIAESKWAFCCSICACREEDRERARQNIKYIVTCDDGLPHRPCCHRVFEPPPESWATSYETAMYSDNPPQEEYTGNSTFKATKQMMHKSYSSAKTTETASANSESTEDPTSRLYTNDDYKEQVKQFSERVQACQEQPSSRRGAVVLDLFSGMGTLMVALKRLSIAVEKVIHCEKDKVASYVYQQNHNEKNTPQCSFVKYSSLEEIMEHFDSFMDQHAPIDILGAGPPCQDFTLINASRQGLDGKKGIYMLLTAELVARIRQDKRQAGQPLYYILENVLLRNEKELPLDFGTKDRIKNALECSWDPIDLDAADVSPCKRLRAFFTNIKLRPWGSQIDKYSDCNPCLVLENGFRLAANLDRYEGKQMAAKCLTFMASSSRINDERMYVYRKRDPKLSEEKYVARCISRTERLLLLGFPPHYLDCLPGLYSTLLQEGHERGFAYKPWRDTLDLQFHQFQGAFHGSSNPFDFVSMPANGDGMRQIKMKLHPYMESSSVRLSWDDYGKRLVGNAMSVPVLEFCLSELTRVFAKRAYEGYAYSYAWRNVTTKEETEGN